MFREKNKKIYDKKSAQLKMESFCAYQERSQQEIRDKLVDMDIIYQEREEIISHLIANNFLNESRFAYAYVSGKFNIKGWGKNKIKQGLKLKNVPDNIIKKALSSIDEDEYQEKLKKILAKKQQELGFKTDLKSKNKVLNYALSKGYETNFIFSILNNKEL